MENNQMPPVQTNVQYGSPTVQREALLKAKANKNHEFIIALYDQRTPQRAVQGSWQCKEQEAVQRLNEINRRYGKEV